MILSRTVTCLSRALANRIGSAAWTPQRMQLAQNPVHAWSVASLSTTPALRSGLDDFFDAGRTWVWSDQGLNTGRAWEATELRIKSFDDLHKLWWVCVKEQNKLCSQRTEAKRFAMVFPNAERLKQVRLTMSRIKHVIWERREAWLQAQEVLKRERARQELVAAHAEMDAENDAADKNIALNEKEIDEQLAAVFPVPIESVGKAAKRPQFQMKHSKKAQERKRMFRRKSSKDQLPISTVV